MTPEENLNLQNLCIVSPEAAVEIIINLNQKDYLEFCTMFNYFKQKDNYYFSFYSDYFYFSNFANEEYRKYDMKFNDDTSRD